MPRRGIDSCLLVLDRMRAQGLTTVSTHVLRSQIALVCGMQEQTIKHYLEQLVKFNLVSKDGEAWRVNYDEGNKMYGI